ncbi:hypothetical protein D3C80_2230010 [compost metagenome]
MAAVCSLGLRAFSRASAGKIRSFFHEPIMFLISSTPSSPAYSFCMMSVIKALTSVSSKIEKPGL